MSLMVWRLFRLSVVAAGSVWPCLGQQPAAPPQSAPSATLQALPPATPPSPSSTSPALTPAAGSQQPVKNADGTYTVRTSARLVILDLVVTDKQNNVVTDLTRDDFQVTEAGEPETILNFERAGSHELAPEVNIASTQDLDRLAPKTPVNIILLDEFNTRFEDMAFARYSLEKWLKQQPDRLSTPTMLLAVGLGKFEVLHDYTLSKEEVLKSLNHHLAAYPWQMMNGNSWAAERYSTAFVTLGRVADAVIGHPGHKNMIWIGRGFPSLNFANVPIDAQERIDNVVQDTVNRLRDARVTLYTIDPAGVQIDPAAYGSAAAFNDPFGGNYQFAKLAKATGGKALYGRNDVDAEIGTSIRDGASFYTLTYRPATTSMDPQKFRRIKVTLDRPGLTVTTREGYYLQRPAGRVDPQNPSRRVATALVAAETSTMVYDGLPLTVTPTEVAGTYVLHVDAAGVAWSTATETEPRKAEMILLVTTFDKKGKELKRDARSLRVSAPKDVPPTGRISLPVNVKYVVQAEAKAVRARVVVRMGGSGRIGTADLDLTGPPAPKT